MEPIKKPMLAGKCEDVNQLRFPLIASPKLDGLRLLTIPNEHEEDPDGLSRAVTRKFKDLPNHFARTWIRHHLPPGVDGELFLRDPKTTFNQIQSALMSREGEPDFIYWVFDIVTGNLADKYTVRQVNLRHWHQGLSPETRSRVHLVPTVTLLTLDELERYEAAVLRLGYEGAMVRLPEGPYKCGRSTFREHYLLKIKRFEDFEAKVVGFVERMHNENPLEEDELGYAKRSSHKENMVPTGTLGALILELPDGRTFQCGTGLNDEQRKNIWEKQEQFQGALATVKCQPYGQKDLPRFPVFKGWRHPDDTGEPDETVTQEGGEGAPQVQAVSQKGPDQAGPPDGGDEG